MSESLYYWEVEAGDCTNIPESERHALRIVPCDQAHDAEVYTKGSVGEEGEGWPGDLIVSIRAEDLCYVGFWDYFVAPDAIEAPAEFDDFLYWWYFPDEETWDLGVREAVCLIQHDGGRALTERLRFEPTAAPD